MSFLPQKRWSERKFILIPWFVGYHSSQVSWYVSIKNGKTPSCWVWKIHTQHEILTLKQRLCLVAKASTGHLQRQKAKCHSPGRRTRFEKNNTSTSKLVAWYDGDVLVAKSKHTEVAACIRFTGYMMHLKFQVACSFGKSGFPTDFQHSFAAAPMHSSHPVALEIHLIQNSRHLPKLSHPSWIGRKNQGNHEKTRSKCHQESASSPSVVFEIPFLPISINKIINISVQKRIELSACNGKQASIWWRSILNNLSEGKTASAPSSHLQLPVRFCCYLSLGTARAVDFPR